MATSNDPFTQLLITLTQENNLPALKSHFPTLTPSTPLLHAIALQSIKSTHAHILTWCFTQGLRLPDSSINNDLYLAACTSQSIPIFQVLVDHGFDLNAHTSEVIGCGTALVAAAFRGNLEFAAWLLEHGQDPNGGFGCEAIVFAASPDNENGSLAMVQLLLKHGLRLHGTGAAIGAAEKNDVDMLKLCLENGSGMEESEIWWLVPRDEGDVEGTALYRACRAGALGSVEFLVGRGANLGWRDERGRDCVAIAREMGRGEVVEWLRARGLIKEVEGFRGRELRMVDERNWAWQGQLPDVFCVD